jgi:hypothetical protein
MFLEFDGRFGVVVGILAHNAKGRGFDSRTVQTFVCMNMSLCAIGEYSNPMVQSMVQPIGANQIGCQSITGTQTQIWIEITITDG